ncbi:MAG: hypothetical protein HQL31_04285 [Planctomycetes bacterium]|nr:hypothetical protein [Planctomycetota bacterium]
MRRKLLLSFFLLLPLSVAWAGEQPFGSLVHLTISRQLPDIIRPWKWLPSGDVVGQGLALDGNTVLTVAHLLDGATRIELRFASAPLPVELEVVYLDRDRDLALLRGSLPEELKPLDMGNEVGALLPSDKVSYGWVDKEGRLKEGSAEVGEYVVSRQRESFQSQLWIQLVKANAQIPEGTPFFRSGSLVGLAAMNAGGRTWIIPREVLESALDFSRAQARGASAMQGFAVEDCTMTALRERLAIAGEKGGCFVSKVFGQGAGSESLLSGDVILRVGGHPVDAWQHYIRPGLGRLNFMHLVSDCLLSGRLPVEIVREGESKTFDLDLSLIDEGRWLIPRYRGGQPSDYLIRGGIVFQPLSLPYLRAWGDGWKMKAPVDLVAILEEHLYEVKSESLHEIIVLSQLLAHPRNRGLQGIYGKVVRSADGKPLSGLSALKAAFDGAQRELLLELEPGGEPLLLDAAALRAADGEIAKRYGVPSLERITL